MRGSFTVPLHGRREKGYKRLEFWEEDFKHVKLMIRLEYDNTTFNEFLRWCIHGYLEKDKDFMEFFFNMKEKHGGYLSDSGIRARKEEYKKENIEKNKYGILDKDEIEDIFDYIENE